MELIPCNQGELRIFFQKSGFFSFLIILSSDIVQNINKHTKLDPRSLSGTVTYKNVFRHLNESLTSLNSTNDTNRRCEKS